MCRIPGQDRDYLLPFGDGALKGLLAEVERSAGFGLRDNQKDQVGG
jgi:hypothetical protein